MNPLFLNPYFVLTALCVLATATGAGYVYGYLNEHERYLAYKSSHEAAEEQGKQDAERREREFDTVVADVSGAWNAALAHAGSRPVVRVLRSDARLCPPGTVPVTGLKPPAASNEQGLGGEIFVAVEQCEQRLAYAAQDAAQVILLTEFIKRTHEASK